MQVSTGFYLGVIQYLLFIIGMFGDSLPQMMLLSRVFGSLHVGRSASLPSMFPAAQSCLGICQMELVVS